MRSKPCFPLMHRQDRLRLRHQHRVAASLLQYDGGTDGGAWWRDVGLRLPGNIRRVKEGACPFAVLREYEEEAERKAWESAAMLEVLAVPHERPHYFPLHLPHCEHPRPGVHGLRCVLLQYRPLLRCVSIFRV